MRRIRRAPYQAVAAISIMSMTLFLAYIFSLLAAGSQVVLRYFETRPQINAFYQQDYVPQPQDIERTKSQLQATGQLDSFKYVSPDDALKIYKELNKSDPLLLEAVTAGMLPASLEVSAKDPNGLKTLSDILKTDTHIDDVRYAEDIVGTLTKWTAALRTIGLALVGTHLFITFIIILLIIGIKIASRRDEIATLQLVGATPAYIAAPFVYEGILYGVFGSLLAWTVSYLLLLYSTGFLVTFLAGIPVLPPSVTFMLQLLGCGTLLGAFVGGIGGSLAAGRYLKE